MALVSTYPDSILQLHASDGDEIAFTEIFSRYAESVRATAYYLLKSEELTEDITQDIFLKLWQDRERLTSIKDLKAYLFMATRNASLKSFRKIKIQQDYKSYLLESVTELDSANGIELTEYKELKKHIEEAIASLPPQQQTAFRLSREKGLTHAEVAKEMNISYRTASEHILKALQNIRQFLQARAAFCLAIFLGIF